MNKRRLIRKQSPVIPMKEQLADLFLTTDLRLLNYLFARCVPFVPPRKSYRVHSGPGENGACFAVLSLAE